MYENRKGGVRQKFLRAYAYISERAKIAHGRRLACLPSTSVCPALLVPARLVSHAAAQAAARHFACACHARPSIHPSHARGHASSQSDYYI